MEAEKDNFALFHTVQSIIFGYHTVQNEANYPSQLPYINIIMHAFVQLLLVHQVISMWLSSTLLPLKSSGIYHLTILAVATYLATKFLSSPQMEEEQRQLLQLRIIRQMSTSFQD